MAFSFYEQHIHEDPDFPIIFHNDNLMEDSNFLSHWHENIEFLYFRQGRGVVLCDAVPYTALPGDAVIINTGALHTIRSQTPVSNYDCLIVDKLFLEGFDLPFEKMRLLSPLRDEVIGAHFDRIARETSEKKPYFKTAVKAETLSLFTHIYRTASRQDLPEGQQNSRKLDMVRSAISYIRQHFTEDITVDDICRHLGFSKYYFCREFRRITGRTVTDTINLLRCSHAKSLISSERYNVSESAERSGFRNLSYFSKTYKRYNGILPSDTEIKL